MEYITWLIDFIIHIDKHLGEIVSQYGTLTYAILFLIVFCETGLVVTPFLPGDSLLFAAGALAAAGHLDVNLLALLLLIAAIIGDTVNYHIGQYLGPNLFVKKWRLVKQEHLDRTEKFFLKYGAKAIVIARFVPIVRTMAPFMAGVGTMPYKTFIFYNVFGALLWIGIFCYGGYAFGELPIVKKNFTLVILAIIILSVLPAVIEIIRARREARASATIPERQSV